MESPGLVCVSCACRRILVPILLKEEFQTFETLLEPISSLSAGLLAGRLRFRPRDASKVIPKIRASGALKLGARRLWLLETMPWTLMKESSNASVAILCVLLP